LWLCINRTNVTKTEHIDHFGDLRHEKRGRPRGHWRRRQSGVSHRARGRRCVSLEGFRLTLSVTFEDSTIHDPFLRLSFDRSPKWNITPIYELIAMSSELECYGRHEKWCCWSTRYRFQSFSTFVKTNSRSGLSVRHACNVE
jgi:hypothetical protein